MNNFIKKSILIISFSCVFFVQSAPIDDFVITVKTNNNNTFTIPTIGNGYDYSVDCNDDGIDEINHASTDYVCDYGASGLNLGAGTYTIRIKDDLGNGDGFRRFYLNNSGDKEYLLDINQWGALNWTSMENAFSGAVALNISAPDSPLLENVTTLNSMFSGAKNVDIDITKWNLTTITDMTDMFKGATLSIYNYNKLLNSLTSRSLQPNVTFGAGNSQYCGEHAADSRDDVIQFDGWVFVDGGICQHSEDDFVMTVKTNNLGDSSNVEFTIPTNSGGFDYSVDCNNDSIIEVENANSEYTCDYGVSGLNTGAGTYTIRIKETSESGSSIPRLRFNNGGDKLKILSVEQWGTIKWNILTFDGAENLIINATDIPDFSQTISFSKMFLNAHNANPDTTNWDTSNVTSMRSMFSFAHNANPNTTNWSTSNVTTMERMFYNAFVANPDTSNWDTSNVTTFEDMFSNAYIANPDTSQWVTTSLENLSGMFVNAQEVRPDTTNWVLTQVIDISFMFNGVSLPSDYYDSLLIDLASKIVPHGLRFDSGASTYCSQAAEDARNLLITNSNWTINDDGRCRFPEADFVITVKTDNTGTSSDTEFLIPTNGAGYYYAVDCNDDGTDEAVEVNDDFTCDYGLTGLNTGAGTYTIRIKQDLNGNGFPTIYFNGEGDHQKIINLNQWGTGNWRSLSRSFKGTINMQVDAVDTPNLSEVEYLTNMFEGALLANPDTTNWDTSNIVSMNSMFDNAQAANPNVTNWDTGNVTAMSRMFRGAVNANPDTINWNTAKVEDLSYMFEGAISANPNTTNWNTTLVSKMSHMFSGAVNANPDTTNWDTTNVNNMSSMFLNATIANPNAENWNTENITYMSSIFKNAINANPDTTMWNLSNLVAAQSMFEGATIANPHTSNWDTSSVIDMTAMFKDATSANPDTSAWLTPNVTRMDHMFDGATSANPVTDTWDVSNVINMTNMFLNVTLSSNTYDSLLINFSSQSLENNMDFHAGNSRYCSINGQLARAALINNFSWDIIDGGLCDLTSTPTSAPDLITDTGINSTDNITSSTELEFAIECTSLGNSINLYSNNPFPNFLITSHTCNSVGLETLQVNFIDQGTHTITYTETNGGIESNHSPALEIVVDNIAPDSPVINAIGTTQLLISGSAEALSGIEISGTTCMNAPIIADSNDNWQCNLEAELNQGTVVSVVSTDVAGNTSFSSNTTVIVANIAPIFNVYCDLDATDVTSEINTALYFQNYITNISVGPISESSQAYTLDIDIVPDGDPDSIIADYSIENENDISLIINTENTGVATVQITMQDDGGVLAGGNDTAIVEFNIHNYPDLNFDPNYMHLDLGDILYKNTFDSCR